MSVVVGILVVVVGILVSIALHEVGHMVPAKRFGVRVSQYMVGFGPTLWSRVRGETEYGFKAIPFGGYVRMVGMYPPGRESHGNGFFSQVVADAREASVEEIRPGEEHRAFYNLSTPKKLVVMLGGPTMNLLIAFVVLIIMFSGIGVPTVTTTVASVADCVTSTSGTADSQKCTSSDTPSPAKAAGLQPGDTIVSLDGKKTGSWDALVSTINANAGQDVTMVVERDGSDVTLNITPAEIERQVVTDGKAQVDAKGQPVTKAGGFVGITPTSTHERQGLGTSVSALWQQVSGTAGLVVALPAKVAGVVSSTVAGQDRDPSSPMSVVGVGRVAVEVAESDSPILDRVMMMLSLVAALNVALFVFNLIPLLPLDGGHVANALYEGAKRQIARVRGLPRPAPADVARMMPVAYVVFVVLVGVGAVLILADIINPVRLG